LFTRVIPVATPPHIASRQRHRVFQPHLDDEAGYGEEALLKERPKEFVEVDLRRWVTHNMTGAWAEVHARHPKAAPHLA
jgi:hypothetical protein